MNSYGPYFDPPGALEINPNNHKKYSLRRRYQNPLPDQINSSKDVKYEAGSFL